MMQPKLKIGFLVRPLWAICLIVLVALTLYIRVLGFDYVWDDVDIFFGTINNLRDGQLDLSRISKPMVEQHQQYFRPLVVITYYWDTLVAGLNPGFSHGVNLVLFILNAMLVFAVCQSLAEKSGRANPGRLAFFASLLYIIHPAMTEATAWISGRFDLLATFFILGATRVYLGSARRYLRVALISVLTFLALLCKETGVTLPVALLCIWLYLNTNREEDSKALYLRALRENASFFMGFMMIFTAYIALRFYAVHTVYGNYITSSDAWNFYERCFWSLEAFKFYLHQALFPFFTTSAMHPITEISPWSLTDILGNITALLIVFFLIIHAFIKRSCSAWLFFAGLSYLVLVLHILPISIIGNIGQDRFLTTPLAFWVMAAVLIRYDLILSSSRLTSFFSSMRLLSARRVAWTLATAWMLGASFATFHTVPFWKNDLLLWGMNYSLYPDDKDIRFNYISIAFADGRYDLAEKALNRILQNPDRHDFGIEEQVFYAKLLVMKGNPEALGYFERIIDGFQEFHTHEQPESPEKLERLRITEIALTAALIYTEYSEAVFVLGSDPEKALVLNDIALWYAKIMGERRFFPWIEYRNAAYLYAMGKFEKADAMRWKIESNIGIDLTKRRTELLLDSYCRNTAVAENCERLRK
jgi:tetratricopeptide (TPR) repeat protein